MGITVFVYRVSFQICLLQEKTVKIATFVLEWGAFFMSKQQVVRQYLEALYLQNTKNMNNYANFLWFILNVYLQLKTSQHEVASKQSD